MRDIVLTIIGRDKASEVFDRVAASAQRSATKMDRASAAMTRTGARLTHGITVPVVALGAAAVKSAADFQKSMTLLQTAGGEAQRNMALVSNGIKKIAAETGTSLGNLADGMYIAEKAGLRGAAGLKTLKAAAEGAKAENVDLGTAMTALTSVMMSYHLHANKAVQVENMLVAGAGKAKTTMQDYAGALSTVIPIASAAHIKFAQVAGAIATLTQHGTDAREATQELSSTIRNLLSPNQVAQKAMQQLGLSVNDVSTKLGKRGLTGTIDLITNAISKRLGPAGTVVVSAFKKSQSATQDLGIELSHMPKQLSDISKQFESGKMSYSDYYKSVKALGGQQFALGKSFLSTFQQAKGFNDLLKSGQPAAQTFVSYLKRIMGGAIGMNTALQLGGENMRYFSKASEDVAAAGAKAGKNISTWAKTQATLAVQADIAKAKLQVMAVNIGDKLMPIALKMVQIVQSATNWFTNLSDSTQNFIIKAALIGAALGPVLGIFGRLMRAVSLLWKGGALLVGWATTAVVSAGRVVAGMKLAEISIEGMSTRSYLAGMRIRNMFTSLGTSVTASLRLLGSAMGGGAVGVGVGELTKNSSNATKVLGVLGSAAGGAAAGFAMGGPLGAAIGGITGAVGDMVVQLRNTGSAAKEGASSAAAAMQQERATADDLLSTLQAINGAYSQQYRAHIAQQLDKAGALSTLNQIGLNNASTISTILGQNGARGIATLTANIENAAAAGKITFRQMDQLVGAIQRISPAAASAERHFELQAKAMNSGVLRANQLNVGYKNLRSVFQSTGRSLDDVTAEGQRNREALSEIAKATNDGTVRALEHGKAVNKATQAYDGQYFVLKMNLAALGFQGHAVDALLAKYRMTPTQIITKMLADTKPGQGSVSQFQNIIDAVRQNKVPGLKADSGTARAIIADLQQRIDALHGKNVDVNVNTHYNSYGTPSASGGRAFATGGAVSGGMPGRDSVPIMAMPGEHVFTTSEVQKAGGQGAMFRLRSAIRSGALRFASGGSARGKSIMSYIHGAGFRGNAADIMYGIVMAESGGNARAHNGNASTGDNSYGLAQINMIGSMGSARRRQFHLRSNNDLYNPSTNLRVAYALSGHGHNFHPWSTYNSGAYQHYMNGSESAHVHNGGRGGSSGGTAGAASARRATAVGSASSAIGAVNGIAAGPRFSQSTFNLAAFHNQVARAKAEIDAAKAAGASAETLKKLRDRLHDITRAGEKTEKALLKNIDHRTGALIGTVNGSAQNFFSTFRSYIAEMKRAGVSAQTVKSLENAETRLAKIRTKNAAVTAKLANARAASAQLSSTVRGAVTGSFDITTAGQTYQDQPATAGSIAASATAAVTKARQFVTVLKKLRKEGLGPDLLGQLASAGPSALPQAQALAAATPKQIAQITGAYASLHKFANQAGGVASDYRYGKNIKALEADRRRYQKEFAKDIAEALAKHPTRTEFKIYGVEDPEAVAKAVERRLARRKA